MVFFVADCSADARVLAELMAKRAKDKWHEVKVRKKNKIDVLKPKIKVIKKKIEPLSDPIITSEELKVIDNVAYLTDKPFTGKQLTYHPNKKTHIELNYKNGIRNGLLVMWDENEQKIGQLNFSNGVQQDD